MDLLPPPTRRELLHRGGLLAGALVVGSWSTAPIGAARPGGASVALAGERRSTYAALAATVLTGPGMRLPEAAAEQAVADFEAVYAAWPDAERRHADVLLDALARDARMKTRPGRVEVLRGSRSPRDGELAYRAQALVRVALSNGGDDHAEVTV